MIVNIRLINELNICRKKINISFRNIYFHINDKDYYNQICDLYILNKYEELGKLSLDESNIKKKPVKIYYTFENIIYKEILSITLKEELNGFAFQHACCPFYTDMKYEMTGKISNDITYDKFTPYYKMNDYFYCYIINDPYTKYYFIAFIIYIISSTFAFFICCRFFPILILIIYILSNIIIIAFYNVKREKIYRIDIIYSVNDRKIFIELVKKKGRSYLKTYTYDIKLIKKFMLSQFENKANRFALKVIDNENEEKFIYNFYGTKEELEGLAYILNKY